MENTNDKNEINFSDIDWNNLSEEKYHQLSEKMLARMKESKTSRKSSKNVTVDIAGKKYTIPEGLLVRIKAAATLETKQKLINEVILNYQPVIDL